MGPVSGQAKIMISESLQYPHSPKQRENMHFSSSVWESSHYWHHGGDQNDFYQSIAEIKDCLSQRKSIIMLN